MKKILLLLTLFTIHYSLAQAQYTLAGKIEFERRSNLHQQLDDAMDDDDKQGSNQWMDMMKKQLPKFMSHYFDYSFSTTAAIYKPGREVDDPTSKMMFGQSPAAQNIVYTDFSTDKATAFKQVFEQKYLVQDSLRRLTWKIADDIRTIANYKCRKAVGKYCDSVYVVAFYTEDIPVSGGPESFAGLPGMILEVAIPRLHTTWIATKVDIIAPKPEDLKAPERGKKVNNDALYKEVMSSVQKWGKFAHRSVWWTML